MATSWNIDNYPPEQIHCAAICAAEDAARVVAFIDAAGLRDSANKPFPFPPQFLLDLGAAFRLLTWEQLGIRLPPELGLPCGRDALLELLHRRTNTIADSRVAEPFGRLARAVFEVSTTHFVWNAKIADQADVRMVSDDQEEPFLTALAKVLWNHRLLPNRGDA